MRLKTISAAECATSAVDISGGLTVWYYQNTTIHRTPRHTAAAAASTVPALPVVRPSQCILLLLYTARAFAHVWRRGHHSVAAAARRNYWVLCSGLCRHSDILYLYQYYEIYYINNITRRVWKMFGKSLRERASCLRLRPLLAVVCSTLDSSTENWVGTLIIVPNYTYYIILTNVRYRKVR